MPATVSVVIPVYNASRYLQACLDCVRALNPAPLECIVVDEGSSDGSLEIAEHARVRVLSHSRPRGPAYARNVGARAARGSIILFLDADVLVEPGAIRKILARFREDPGLDAIIGSYDDEPGSDNFISQYRNLLHTYIHQSSKPETCTFWTGCGAIRRSVLLAHGGFSENYSRPCVEDIELGVRLRRAGHRIWLDKSLVVKHLKSFGFGRLLKTDVCDRAIPWTMLILRTRSMPVDLNLKWNHRVSVIFAGLAALAGTGAALAGAGFVPGSAWLWTGTAMTLVMALVFLNQSFYRFLARRKGLVFAAGSFPVHWLHFLCSGIGFGLGLAIYALQAVRQARREKAAKEVWREITAQPSARNKQKSEAEESELAISGRQIVS